MINVFVSHTGAGHNNTDDTGDDSSDDKAGVITGTILALTTVFAVGFGLYCKCKNFSLKRRGEYMEKKGIKIIFSLSPNWLGRKLLRKTC